MNQARTHFQSNCFENGLHQTHQYDWKVGDPGESRDSWKRDYNVGHTSTTEADSCKSTSGAEKKNWPSRTQPNTVSEIVTFVTVSWNFNGNWIVKNSLKQVFFAAKDHGHSVTRSAFHLSTSVLGRKDDVFWHRNFPMITCMISLP